MGSDKQPTQEQIKEFWEWCGFEEVWAANGSWWQYESYKETNHWWEDSSSRKYKELPPVDLNNLFKYAVPKALEDNSSFIDLQTRRYIAPTQEDLVTSYICEIWSDNGQGSIVRQSQDVALALFWAIWEVIHG